MVRKIALYNNEKIRKSAQFESAVGHHRIDAQTFDDSQFTHYGCKNKIFFSRYFKLIAHKIAL